MLKAFIGILALALVGMWAQALHYGHVMSGRATAEVVSLRQTSTTPYDYCPVLRWSAGEQTHEHESVYCDEERVPVGSSMAIRFDPEEPSVVSPDDWYAMYGHLAIFTPLLLALLGGALWVELKG